MSKKDTIVIAGLVNAALLAMLMIFTVDAESKEPQVVAKVETPPPVVKQVKVEPVVVAPPVQKLAVLDEGDELLKVAEKKEVTPAKKEEEWYVVKNGDSPWKIAKANDVTTDEILKLNHMSEEKAKSMRPGDKIRIR